MVNPRVTSGPGQASVPTRVADASEVIGKMRPADVVFLADAEVASSADRVGVASPADCAEVWPLAVTEVASPAVAEVASSADFAQAASSPLLRWRPWPLLLRWRPRPTPWVLLTHMAHSEWVMMTVVWLRRVVE